MFRSSTSAKILATALTLAVPLLGIPVQAGTAQLSGHVYSSVDEQPLIGVTVYAAQPETGRVFPSEPSTEAGSFSIGELPSGKFELGVAIDRGLYLVETPIALAPAQSQYVNIAINEKKQQSAAAPNTAAAKPSAWNNPLTAALIVVGAALVVGLLVEAATDDDDEPASPM